MTRFVRLILVGLMSTTLALGFTVTGANAAQAPSKAPAAAVAATESCASAQQQDSQAAASTTKFEKKVAKAKKKLKKAKKVLKQASTSQHRKAVKKAKAKKKKAVRALKNARSMRTTTTNRVIVFCGTTPDGQPVAAGTSTPGTSPLAPLCLAVPSLTPLCTMTAAIGNTTPLAPLCAAIPELAALCAIRPGDLADPAAVQGLLTQLQGQGATLLPVALTLVTRLLSGDLRGVAQQLALTPSALASLLRGLGVPVPVVPGLP